MGCRAAVALARQLSDDSQDAVQGVICLSFPLHPPGQTQAHQQRSEDLRMLPEHMSVLFVSGTEDNMCDRVREAGTNTCCYALHCQIHSTIMHMIDNINCHQSLIALLSKFAL